MSTSASSEARTRWSAFLKQIADRHRAIGVEAAQVTAQDPANASNAWNAFTARMVDLEARIIDTWNEKVEAAYEAEGLPHDTWWADRALGDDLAFELEIEREQTQHRLFPDNPHARAWTAAQAEWLEMKRADRARRQARSPAPLAVLQRDEKAQIAYWRVYMTATQRENPAIRDIALEVRSRMHQWYEYTAEHEEEWRKAGRPRAPI